MVFHEFQPLKFSSMLFSFKSLLKLRKRKESGLSASNGCYINCFKWDFEESIIQMVKNRYAVPPS